MHQEAALSRYILVKD